MFRYTNRISALMSAVPELIEQAPTQAVIDAAVARGAFRPEEDDTIGYWFGRFVTLRRDLWELLDDVDEEVNVALVDIDSPKEWCCFLIGFAAACLLVRLDRYLVFEFATHTLTQRKLNEAFPEYRIKRKQFSQTFSDYTDPANMVRLYDAIKRVKKKRKYIESLKDDEFCGEVVKSLPVLHDYINSSRLSYLRRLLIFLRHRWRRRGASAKHKTMFAVLELSGRITAKFNPGEEKSVTQDTRSELMGHLKPGDVLVTRHKHALSNQFIPGLWPHAALFIGTEQQRETFGVNVSPPIAHRWKGVKCTLEALRDGVLFRPLEETLNVDAFAVLRPRLSDAAIVTAIERIVKHEGKLYNFDFDFFSSDRLVCTEVIYRAFDGLEEMDMPLIERAGRKTLTAEDILDLALSSDQFQIYAVFGFPEECKEITYGEDAIKVITQLRSQAPNA